MSSEITPSFLSAGLQELFKKSHHHDFVIQCGQRKWKVHKAILHVATPYFAGLFENDYQENETGILDLSVDEPSVINAMLEYMYGGKYDDAALDAEEKITFAAKVFVIADKYQFKDLKAESASQIEILIDKPLSDGRDFSRAVQIIYENTNDVGGQEVALRGTLVECAWNCSEMFMRDDGFRAMLKEVSGFGADVAIAGMENSTFRDPQSNTYRCPNCSFLCQLDMDEYKSHPDRYCAWCGDQFSKGFWEQHRD
ncbi:MAG: hypothetical protein M1820_004194 [Bogoriella megaspora]|nr:MAG: hypothetical protein M1820_004194 [Bogoriella megaspora]